MKDTIYRQDAIDAVTEGLKGIFVEYRDIAEKMIGKLPSTEPERKTGKWIRITKGAIPEKYICPFCHREVENYGVEGLLPIIYPFCHCGADMRGEE